MDKTRTMTKFNQRLYKKSKQASVALPRFGSERGGHTRLRERERWEPIRTKAQTFWYSRYSIIPLRYTQIIRNCWWMVLQLLIFARPGGGRGGGGGDTEPSFCLLPIPLHCCDSPPHCCWFAGRRTHHGRKTRFRDSLLVYNIPATQPGI